MDRNNFFKKLENIYAEVEKKQKQSDLKKFLLFE